MKKKSYDYAKIIQKHYGLKHPVSVAEVNLEITNLQRKIKSLSLDDRSRDLACKLKIL